MIDAWRRLSDGVAPVVCVLGLSAAGLIVPPPPPSLADPMTAAEPPAAPAQPVVPFEQPLPPEQRLDPNAALRIPAGAAEGRSIEQVVLYLRNPLLEPVVDKQLRQRLRNTFAVWAGANFSELITESNLSRVQRLPEVREAEVRLYTSKLSGAVILVLLVTLQPVAEPPQSRKPQLSGWLATGRPEDFPRLYQSDRTFRVCRKTISQGEFSTATSSFPAESG